jgi:hypothetical protein
MKRALLLIAITAVVMVGCSKNDSANQSSANPSAVPTVAAAVATNVLMAKLPVFPGAALAISRNTTVSGKHLQMHSYTTPDAFDKVYKWYQAAVPADAKKSHETSQGQEAAVFVLTAGTTQQTVTIVRTGGVEVTNITLLVSKE